LLVFDLRDGHPLAGNPLARDPRAWNPFDPDPPFSHLLLVLPDIRFSLKSHIRPLSIPAHGGANPRIDPQPA
jgi:hypothetical protein